MHHPKYNGRVVGERLRATAYKSAKKQIVSLSTQPCHNEISRNNLPHNAHVAVYALAFGDVLAFASSTRMTKSTRSWPTQNFDSCGFVTLQRHHKLFHEIPLSNLLRIVMETNLGRLTCPFVRVAPPWKQTTIQTMTQHN